MIKKCYVVASNTFLETVRQPIFGILMWVAAVWMAVFGPTLSAFTLEAGSDTKMLVDSCLATLLLYGLLASVFSATGVITREIESYTVLTVVSKPVNRSVFFAGKFAGVMLALLIAFYFLSLVFVLTVRHGVMERASDKWDQPVLVLGGLALGVSLLAALFCNYVYNWNFSVTLTAWVVPSATLALGVVLFFDAGWNPQSPVTNFGYKGDISPESLLYAVILIFSAVAILTAFAVALSTRFSQVVTLMFCAGIFLLGLLSDYYFGDPAVRRTLLGEIGGRLLPNFQFFWLGDAITQQLVISGKHCLTVVVYAVLYTLGILFFGAALFQTREVG